MRVLLISHLWPREDAQHLGIFVYELAAQLRSECDLKAVVPVDRMLRGEEASIREFCTGLKRFRRRTRPLLRHLDDVELRVAPFKALIPRGSFAGATAQRLGKALQNSVKEPVDIVHAHTLYPDGIACAHWLQNSNTPLVITVHGSDVHTMPHGVRLCLPLLFQRTNRFIAVSRFLADTLIDLGADERKIRVLPNGIDGQLFKNVNFDGRDQNRIAFLGRLGSIKRVDLLIRALSLCDAKISLDIGGDGPQRSALQQLVRKLGLEDRVVFHGAIARKSVPAFLAKAALLGMVSRMEGWPLVIYESLACGTPVLATAVGGIPEALQDPRVGVLVAPDCAPDELAQKIQSSLQIPWDRQFMRLQALQHTWQSIAQDTVALYRELSERNVSSFIPESCDV
ncbi:MAG: glycosyltransferase [bacterium]